MVFPFAIDVEKRVAVVTLSGSVTGADLANTLLAVYDHADWQPHFDTFWDGSAVTETVLDRDEMATLLRLQREQSSRAGMGVDVIVASRLLDYAAARWYALLAKHENRRIAVCRTPVEGWAALGRTPRHLQR